MRLTSSSRRRPGPRRGSRLFWIPAYAGMTIALGAACNAHAQTYPAKPVRFLVGFAPGGFTDVMARAIAGKLAESRGQTVIVDNRPGSSAVLRAPHEPSFYHKDSPLAQRLTRGLGVGALKLDF